VIGAVQTAQGLGVFVGVLLGPKLYSMNVEAPVIVSACFLTAGFVLSLIIMRGKPPPQTRGDRTVRREPSVVQR
jgi:hypothetical protein